MTVQQAEQDPHARTEALAVGISTFARRLTGFRESRRLSTYRTTIATP